jgi:feruloyl-CoA synthase
LRARILAHFAPFVRDAVIAGHDRDEVGMLIVPDVEACRAICASNLAGAPACDVLRDSAVAERLSRLMVSFAACATGSASRVARALVLEEPPSLDGGEVTDKGSLNQAAILRRRNALVEELFAATPGARVIRAESLNEC